MKNTENLSDKEMMHAFISQFYSKEIIPPSGIISPFLLAEAKSIDEWLKQRKEEKVRISAPRKGKKRELLLMASENAKIKMIEKREIKIEYLLMEIKEKLGL